MIKRNNQSLDQLMLITRSGGGL